MFISFIFIIMKSNVKSDYDTHALRRIPIVDIAHNFGFELRKSGKNQRVFIDGKPRSIIIHPENYFRRYSCKSSGGCKGGDPINFTMHMLDCSREEALIYLSQNFL